MEKVVLLALRGQFVLQTLLVPKAYRFRLLGDDGQPALESSLLFTSRAAAQSAYFEALFSARTADHWRLVHDQPNRIFTLELVDETGTV